MTRAGTVRSASKDMTADRFYIWPSVATAVLVFLFVIIVQMSPSLGFMLVICWVLITPFAGVALVGFCILLAVRKRWKKSLSFAAIPVIAWALHQPVLFCCDYVHLLLLEPVYQEAIAASGKPPGARFAAFDWSVGFAGGPNTFLIYDETDAISRPFNDQPGIATQEDGFGPDCAGKVRHLLAHYYVCDF